MMSRISMVGTAHPTYHSLPSTLYSLPPNLKRFQITEQIGHFLGTWLKLGHRWRISAGDLFDQAMRGFALGNIPQTRTDASASIQPMTTTTVDLEDGMS